MPRRGLRPWPPAVPDTTRGRRAERRAEAIDRRRVAGDEQVEVGQGRSAEPGLDGVGLDPADPDRAGGSSWTSWTGSATTVTSAVAPAAHDLPAVARRRPREAAAGGVPATATRSGPRTIRRVAADRVDQHDARQPRAPRPDEPLAIRPASRDPQLPILADPARGLVMPERGAAVVHEPPAGLAEAQAEIDVLEPVVVALVEPAGGLVRRAAHEQACGRQRRRVPNRSGPLREGIVSRRRAARERRSRHRDGTRRRRAGGSGPGTAGRPGRPRFAAGRRVGLPPPRRTGRRDRPRGDRASPGSIGSMSLFRNRISSPRLSATARLFAAEKDSFMALRITRTGNPGRKASSTPIDSSPDALSTAISSTSRYAVTARAGRQRRRRSAPSRFRRTIETRGPLVRAGPPSCGSIASRKARSAFSSAPPSPVAPAPPPLPGVDRGVRPAAVPALPTTCVPSVRPRRAAGRSRRSSPSRNRTGRRRRSAFSSSRVAA